MVISNIATVFRVSKAIGHAFPTGYCWGGGGGGGNRLASSLSSSKQAMEFPQVLASKQHAICPKVLYDKQKQLAKLAN